MALLAPAFTDDLTYPFSSLRMMMNSLVTPGVVRNGDMVVTPAAGLQVQIAAGSAYVQQTVAPEDSFLKGLYLETNDAPANPVNTILAPITNPRIDQLILRVYDVKEQVLGGSSKAQFEWLQGTESASASLVTMGPGLSNPGAAALPDNSLRLAYVLQTVGESSIPGGNIVNAAPLSAPVSGPRGASNIAASESRTNVAYGTMPTPDQVSGIVLPTNGLIRVWYQAAWQESVAGAGAAAIFIGANQLQVQYAGSNAPVVQSAVTGSGTPAINLPLVTAPFGLATIDGSVGFAADVTTGQAIGAVGIVGKNLVAQFASSGALPIGGTNTMGSGGSCDIFAAAGTYTVGVQFKASSGSVTASNRKLLVQAISFS